MTVAAPVRKAKPCIGYASGGISPAGSNGRAAASTATSAPSDRAEIPRIHPPSSPKSDRPDLFKIPLDRPFLEV